MENYTFRFRYKHRPWTVSHKEAIGHKYEEAQNKMVVYFKNKTIEISDWRNCAIILGPDWFAYEKHHMEKEVGQPIKTTF